MALTDKIKAIADAIRTKTGTTDTMTLEEMPNKIINIPSGTSGDSGVKKPYIEETYDKDGNLIAAKLVGYTKVRDKLFTDCSNLALTELPSGVTTIGNYAFYGCTNLALTELPSGIASIGEHAFQNCSNLALTELPSSIISINSLAFIYCTKLTSIRFLGTPTSIDSSAFTGCTNLTTIKVPWSEGVVANAPWGATNATVTYDYTG